MTLVTRAPRSRVRLPAMPHQVLGGTVCWVSYHSSLECRAWEPLALSCVASASCTHQRWRLDQIQ